jgi:hypothetical protein
MISFAQAQIIIFKMVYIFKMFFFLYLDLLIYNILWKLALRIGSYFFLIYIPSFIINICYY